MHVHGDLDARTPDMSHGHTGGRFKARNRPPAFLHVEALQHQVIELSTVQLHVTGQKRSTFPAQVGQMHLVEANIQGGTSSGVLQGRLLRQRLQPCPGWCAKPQAVEVDVGPMGAAGVCGACRERLDGGQCVAAQPGVQPMHIMEGHPEWPGTEGHAPELKRGRARFCRPRLVKGIQRPFHSPSLSARRR